MLSPGRLKPGLWIMDGVKALEPLNAFLRTDRDTLAKSPAMAYRLVAWSYRCTQIRANAVKSMPFSIKRLGTDEDVPDAEIPWKVQIPRLLWLTEASLCIHGRAYWFHQKNLVVTLGLQYLAPGTIRERYDNQNGLLGFERSFARPSQRSWDDGESDMPTAWTDTDSPGSRDRGVSLGRLNLGAREGDGRQRGGVQRLDPGDVVYFWYPDPEVEVGPGRSPAMVAQESAGLVRSSGVFAQKFFERGAIPATLLQVPAGTSEVEAKKLESWWKNLMMGVKNAWKTVAVRADVKPVVIGQPIRDLGMPGLEEAARRKIAVAFGVPISLLEDAASYATAVAHRKSFYVETVVPECELIAQTLNEQLFNRRGWEIKFHPEQLEVMQADEAERAGALNGLVGAGIPLLDAMEILGYKPPDDVQQRISDEVTQILQASIQARMEAAHAQNSMELGRAFYYMTQGGMPMVECLNLLQWPMDPATHQSLVQHEAQREQLVQETAQRTAQQQALQVAEQAQQTQAQAQAIQHPNVAPRLTRRVPVPGARPTRGPLGTTDPVGVEKVLNAMDLPPTRGTIPGNGLGRGYGA